MVINLPGSAVFSMAGRREVMKKAILEVVTVAIVVQHEAPVRRTGVSSIPIKSHLRI
jgi:hypothetical protein